MSRLLAMSIVILLALPGMAGAVPARSPSGAAATWHQGSAMKSLAKRRKKKKKQRRKPKEVEDKQDKDKQDEDNKPFVEEPPDVDGTPARPPEVFYPDEQDKDSGGQKQPAGPGEPDTTGATDKPAGDKQPEGKDQPPDGPAVTEPAGDAPDEQPGPPAKQPGTEKTPATTGDAKPEPKPEPKTPVDEERASLFRVELYGGMRVPRSRRLQFGGGALFAVDLGSLVGWRGLYLFAEQDAFVGEDQLGQVSYVLLDTLGGLQGRFALGPVRLVAGIGFGARFMAVTENLSDPRREPEVGFGACGLAGVELPLGDLVSLLVRADARYMKNPLSGQFYWSGVFVAGVGLTF